MSEFYRKPSSINEHFILRNLNPEIEHVIKNDIFTTYLTGKVLDIGCGNQPLKKHFTEKGYSYKGLDFKQNSLNNVDFVGQIDDPSLQINEKFEIVICTEVLEHVLDWKVAFDNMAKLCSPEGLVLITCPMFYPLHEEPFDYWRPTPYALIEFAKRNGFSIIKEKKLGDGKDVLGTLLKNSYFYPKNKKRKTLFYTALINKARNFIINKLVEQNDQVIMESPFFISNLFLLKKNS
jgi:SAM-dependent methyltransferase